MRMDLNIAREFWNGAWTLMCIILLYMLVLFLLENLWRNRGHLRKWYYEPGSRVAMALVIFVSGSALRAAWIWARLDCENATLDEMIRGHMLGANGCSWVYSTASYALEVSGFLAITGAICLVRVLSPRHWLPWSWIGALVLALLLPVVVL